ncbi:MAG: hypothetical protein AAFY88_04775 [Acidobacteriota bacterium]
MPQTIDRSQWANRFVRNILLWIVPVAAVWLVVTPIYNPFLTKATENLVRLFEDPASTRLVEKETHHFIITRTDLPSRALSSVRVTDAHFPLILTGVLFLAVPGLTLRRRLENLGWATLVSVFFHILLLFLWVQFTYATQLGRFSAENYTPFAREAWGLAKHLADLPFKFSLPLVLWSIFYLRELFGSQAPAKPAKPAKATKKKA